MEDDAADRADRESALGAYRALVHWLARGGNGIKRMRDGSFLVTGSMLGLRSPHDSIRLLLRPQGTEEGVAAAYGQDAEGNPVIAIDALPDGHLTIDDLARLSRREAFRSSFVHEFVHHLDELKGNRVDSSGSTVGSNDYYNDRAEIEAYYQQHIEKAESAFERASPNDLAKLVRLSDETIAKLIEEKFFYEFMPKLNAEQANAVRARIMRFVRGTVRQIIRSKVG